MGCILSLFKSNNTVIDAPEPQDEWRSRLRSVKSKIENEDVSFAVLLSLYASHSECLSDLYVLSEKKEEDVIFYIPQIGNFLLHGDGEKLPLETFFIQKSLSSLIFAHRSYWFLRSFSIKNEYVSELMDPLNISDSLHPITSNTGINALLKAIEEHGVSSAIHCDMNARDSMVQSSSLNFERTNSFSASLVQLKPVYDVNTIKKKRRESKDFGLHKHKEGLLTAVEEGDTLLLFRWEINFFETLNNIGEVLRSTPRPERNNVLRQQLDILNETFLPSGCIYVPVVSSSHCVVGVVPNESFCFSTRERVPFLLCIECVDVIDKNQMKKDMKKKKNKKTKKSTKAWNMAKGLFIGVKARATSLYRKEEKTREHVGSDAEDYPLVKDKKYDHLGQWSTQWNTPGVKDSLDGFLNKSKDYIPKRTRSYENLSPKSEGDIEINFDDKRLSINNLSPCTTHSNSSSAHENSSLLTSSGANSPLISLSPSPLVEHLTDVEDDDSQHDDIEDEGDLFIPGRRSTVLFREKWADKEKRIKLLSSYSHLPGWRLVPVIMKNNDDLRQEQIASQLLKQFDSIFKEHNVDVWMRPYEILATSPSSGLLEAIPDTISIDSLNKNDKTFTSLSHFFLSHFPTTVVGGLKTARGNFAKSLAAYSIVTYLLQVKDRHNGNILIDSSGHIIHIDFGFILGNSPGKNSNFENAPFKLTNEYIKIIGGPSSRSFSRFKKLCIECFLAARKSKEKILLMVEMIFKGNESLPCFSLGKTATLDGLRDRLQLQLSDKEAEKFVCNLIYQSNNQWRTNWYDKFQRWSNGIM